jgi:hypothetical protein
MPFSTNDVKDLGGLGSFFCVGGESKDQTSIVSRKSKGRTEHAKRTTKEIRQ